MTDPTSTEPRTAAEALALMTDGSTHSALPRHRHHLTTEEVETSQRWRLLAATAEVIAREGYGRSSVDQIATQAGVSKKAFYKFFADKEAAFLAAYDVIELVIAGVTAEAESTPPATPAELVDTVFGTYVRTLQSAPSLATMLLLRAHGSTPAIMDRRLRGVAAYADALGRFLEQNRTAGMEIAELSHQEVVALLGGINELCIQHVHRSGIADLDQVSGDLRSFALRVLTP